MTPTWMYTLDERNEYTRKETNLYIERIQDLQRERDDLKAQLAQREYQPPVVAEPVEEPEPRAFTTGGTFWESIVHMARIGNPVVSITIDGYKYELVGSDEPEEEDDG